MAYYWMKKYQHENEEELWARFMRQNKSYHKPFRVLSETVGIFMEVKGGRGQEQKHARIVISKNKTFTDICHDTGEAELDSLSARVEFEPQPYTRYYWKVIVTTDAEEVIESDTQFFETAKMDEPWTGRWITCDSSQERHPIFSKRIRPAKEVKSARLYICGLGLYEAYFLGENKEILENR